MGTIWRDFSKPLKGRQCPDPHLLWLSVGTPSALWPGLASTWAKHILFWLNIFLIYYFHHLIYLCNYFYGLSTLVGCWFSVFIRRIIYKFKCVTFWVHSFCGWWEGLDLALPLQLGGCRYLNWPSQVGRQSFFNRSFLCRFCLVTLLFGILCCSKGFCQRTETDLFHFLFTNPREGPGG